MDRRNWMRFALLSAALAIGVVVVAPTLAPAAIPQHVKDYLNGEYGDDGWLDGGHEAGPPHYHWITDEDGNRIGRVIQNADGSWTFEDMELVTYTIPAAAIAS